MGQAERPLASLSSRSLDQAQLPREPGGDKCSTLHALSAKQKILERRRRFVAAALATLGCGTAAGPSPHTGTSGAVPERGSSRGSATGSGTQPVPSVEVPPPAPTAPSAGLTLDTDGDGIPDASDACPTVAGVSAVDSTSNGCPPRPCLTILSPSEIQIDAKIYFDPGSDRIEPAARSVLDEIGRLMTDYPEMELEIIGYSDATEPESLSRSRADKVRSEIVARGVAPTRLTATGVGARQPVAPSGAALGRAENRRVEFIRRGPTRPLGAP
jgi:outer membrane protein OmpA-like peptidoglycan-associated protein